ncbi:MAG TPA: 2-dehydro-3-deoxygalactonokinase [Puia sp.]|nr:2-dehydro-3-deoxygalactonokinase [Puia sp.]
MPDSNHFISCDWGTTSLRLRLVEAHTLRVLAGVKDDQGIAAAFQLWKNTGKGEAERIPFYRSLLEARVQQLQASPLSGIPLIISGMASSSIGMKELPYKELPFSVDGKDLRMEIFEATEVFPHRTLLLSGVRSSNDVMRGEETQLIGCFPSPASGERIFIFPGTHSKHIRVRDGKVIDFKTYMTGEFFSLLIRHSILAGSVAEPTGSVAETAAPAVTAFQQGVLDSIDANLLHHSFLVRTHQLFGALSKEDNYHYLSGLLIGSECKDLIGTCLPLTLVSSGTLRDPYTNALQALGITDFEIQDLDQTVIAAHARMSKSFLGK